MYFNILPQVLPLNVTQQFKQINGITMTIIYVQCKLQRFSIARFSRHISCVTCHLPNIVASLSNIFILNCVKNYLKIMQSIIKYIFFYYILAAQRNIYSKQIWMTEKIRYVPDMQI